MPADISVARTVRVTNRCRVVLDTNRYSVPHLYASQQLKARHLNERIHINKIVALTEIHSSEKVALAIEDAIQSQAYSSQYIENILEQRSRNTPTPGPLHLTRRSDLLDLELPSADLTPYDTI